MTIRYVDGLAMSHGAIHAWLGKTYPRTGRCDECHGEGKTEYAFTRHPEDYTRDRDDYRELCRPCHQTLDGYWGQARIEAGRRG